MKKRSLVSLIIPLCALSGCSYNGDAKPLMDGDLLLRESFVVRDDSFTTIDSHIKAKDTFCLYISLEGCDSCALFENGLKKVAEENKVLTFHMETPQKKDDIISLTSAYPAFDIQYFPSFFIVQGTNIEKIPYEQVNSESRLRNTLKRKIMLTNNYYFESETVDYVAALNKANLNEATLVQLDFSNGDQIAKYQTVKNETDEPLFIHQKPGLSDIQISKVTK